MAKKLKPDRSRHVHCEVCHRNLPRVGALSAEGKDYTAYFCGTQCYRHWHQRAPRTAGSATRG